MSSSPPFKSLHERSLSCCKSPFGYWPVTLPPRCKSKMTRNPSLSQVTNYGLEPLSLGDLPESVSFRQAIRCPNVRRRRKESISKGIEAGESGERDEAKLLEVVLLENPSQKHCNSSASTAGYMIHRYSLPHRLTPIKKPRQCPESDREDSTSDPYFTEKEEGFQQSPLRLQGRMGGWMLTRVKAAQIQGNKPVLRRKVYRRSQGSRGGDSEELYLKYLRLKQITNKTPSQGCRQ